MNNCFCILVQFRGKGQPVLQEKLLSDVLLLHLDSTKIYMVHVLTLLVLKWMLCTCLQRLWPPAMYVCVCVRCCRASVLSADQWRLAAGRQAAIHLSAVQLCNVRERRGKDQKEGERKGAHVSRQILQVLLFIIL